MSQSIDELKAEHRVLLEHLAKAKELGCYTPEARQYIYKIEKEFRDHLQKEDELLYNSLRKVAKKDTHTKVVLESFAKDLKAVTDDVVNFFENHAKDSDHEHFAKDIVHLIASVEARILKEEAILYPLQQKHAS